MRLFFTLLFLLTFWTSKAQTIPSGFPVLEDYLRRQQITSEKNDLSFSFRPLALRKSFPDLDVDFFGDSLPFIESINSNDKVPVKFSLLPLWLTTTYSSNYPYPQRDGPMIPAKGFQSLLALGFHSSIKNFRFQFYPEIHYAQNLPFEEYAVNAPREFFLAMNRDVQGTEIPVRFEGQNHFRFLPGNSFFLFDFGAFSTGISTERFQWGPGQFNNLLISGNSNGFLHFTLKTNKPAKTFLGNFEGQYFAGKLDNYAGPHFSDGAYSEILKPKVDIDWRYFTGLSLSYSPKWLPNLFAGFSRTFQIYRNDMLPNLRAWFPIFDPFPKSGKGVIENIQLREDQHVAIFARYVIPKSKMELYFELIKNDHSFNWRDLILNPEHTRGFNLGFSKVFQSGEHQFLLRSEMNHTQIPVNNIIRLPSQGVGIYFNGQVRQGLTHQGQLLGSSTGQSGNFYLIEFSKIEGMNKIGFTLERLAREQNFYHNAIYRDLTIKPWVDLGLGFLAEGKKEKFYYSGEFKFIQSLNYNWNVSENISGITGKNQTFNLFTNLKVAYLIN